MRVGLLQKGAKVYNIKIMRFFNMEHKKVFKKESFMLDISFLFEQSDISYYRNIENHEAKSSFISSFKLEAKTTRYFESKKQKQNFG